jgi:hypothetical protein
MAYGKIKADTLVYDDNGTNVEKAVSAIATAQGIVKKVHTFTFATRTTGNSSAANQFTWTSSFSPVDATNNSFIITGSVPANGAGNDFSGYGLRIGSVDFQGYGSEYCDEPNQTHQSYHFHVGAGVLATSANQTITHRTYTTTSQVDTYMPNSSDQARLSAQTRGFLTIIEYKNN